MKIKGMKIIGIMALACLSPVGLGAQWMTGFYSAQNGVLPVSSIPWTKYTHIVHFAASTPGDGTVIPSYTPHYLTQDEINQVIAARPPGKNVLICIKDNDGIPNAMALSTSPALIAAFVTNIVNFVKSNGYDGVDMDWEHSVNVSQYEDLLARLRNAMPGKVIVIDVGNWEGLETVAAASQSQLDQVNIMCYDMDLGGQNCGGQDCTWFEAPLLQDGQADKRTCDWRVRSFLNAGLLPGKIGIGVPFYARRWSGAVFPGVLGEFQNYTLAFRDLVTDPVRWQSIFKHYDTGFKADYLSIPILNEFISYTGDEAISDLVNWSRSQGFGGFMTYALDYEYLPAQTGDARYPLSTDLHSHVFGN